MLNQETVLSQETREERVAREDLVMFINACFACTGQREFYSDASGQSVSIDFLHQYILGNYRRLYAETLSAGVNHFNKGQIVLNLLATGAMTEPLHRLEENALLTKALVNLPPQRVYRLFEALRDRRVNNRRTRALVKGYLAGRKDLAFDAIKYRGRLRVAASHVHLTLPGELGTFLFGGWKQGVFRTELLESFRQAHYSKSAVYRLPYTVAEGLAAKHRIPRDEFLANISKRMTFSETLRLQSSAKASSVALELDLARAPLTKLAIYVASLSASERATRHDELEKAFTASSARTYRRSPYRLGRVAAILDRSYSSSGSSEKRKRPLAVAMASSYLLRQASREYRAFWTPSLATTSDFDATPYGQSDLVGPLLEALRWKPEFIVIVSDGYENSPPGAVNEVLRVARKRFPQVHEVSVVHLNPVFDAQNFAPKGLGPEVPTVGIRSAEDLLTMIGFARFAEGTAPLVELETYLEGRVASYLRGVLQ